MSNIDYSALINGSEVEETPAVMSMTRAASDTWYNMPGHDRYYNQGSTDLLSDDAISEVDEGKNIKLHKNSISITSEQYGQYIPFVMDRYQDGIDLAKSTISFNYLAPGMPSPEASVAVNAQYNDTKIRFGWLVPYDAVLEQGTLRFEIEANGTFKKIDEQGTVTYPSYTWRTRPSDTLKVIQGIGTGVEIDVSDSDWQKAISTAAATAVATTFAENKLTDTFYTKPQVDDAIAAAIATVEKPNLTPYVQKDDVSLTVDNTTYEITLTWGNGYTSTINLPLESLVLDAEYDKATKELVITLNVEDEKQVRISLSDLIDGLTTTKDVEDIIAAALANYYTKQQVDDAIAAADISEKLTEYVKTERLGELGVNTDEEGNETPKTVKEYVDEAVASVDVTEQLKDYAKTDYVDEAVKNVQVDLTGYATEEYVNDAVKNVQVDLTDYYTQEETNRQINTTLDSALGEILADDGSEITVKDYIDNKAGAGGEKNFYKATYGEAEIEGQTQKNIFTLWTAKEDFDPEQPGETEVSIASQFQITGGSGGGDSSLNKLIIYYDTSSAGTLLNKYVFREEDVADEEAIIKYSFTGTEPNGATIASADATWEYREGSSGAWKVIKTETIVPTSGTDRLTFNVSEYLTKNTTYQFRLKAVDASGAVANASWTVQRIIFKIETSFNDKKKNKIGDINFYYTPYGASIEKTINFKWDNKILDPVKTSRSGTEMSYTLPISVLPEATRHGSHLLEVYMTAVINGEAITSEYIYKDIVLFDEARTVPVITCAPQTYTIPQYSTINIDYAVFDPTTSYPKITLDIDGKAEEITLDKEINALSFKSDVVGTHTITISCTNSSTTIITTKTITVVVEDLGYEIAPVEGAVIDFDPVGKMNSERVELDNGDWKIWNNDTYSLITSADFDWVNGGFQNEKDKNGAVIAGSEHFKIKAGDRAYFDYKFFGGDKDLGTELNPKDSGKDFKIVFKTEKVRRAEAKFLTCLNDNNGAPIGMEMFVHEGYIYCGGGTLRLPYSEEDIIEYGFKIAQAGTNRPPVVMGYEDGVTTSALIYNTGHSFIQPAEDRKYIELGSDDCDLLIYKLKIYEKELKDNEIPQNFVADARTGEEMISRHERNLIYNDNGELDPVTLSKKCPWLRVITVSAPTFTQGKKYPVGDTTIEYRYENGKKDGSISYWKCVNGVHIGQGTSSDLYGAAGRNLDLVLKKHKDIGNTPTIYLDEGETITAKKVALTPSSIPVDYFNVKVNIASSENANNALLQKRFNKFQPYKRPFVDSQYIDGFDDEGKPARFTPKDTMEFYNCIVFIQETGATGHQEFDDTDIHFYAIGNIGDSKKTDKTRLTDPSDDYECCLEIADVALPLSDFPVDTIVNAMRYEVKADNSIEYLFATDDNLKAGLLYVKDPITGEYIQATGDTVDVKNTVYYIDGKTAEDFGGDFTYEWRYMKEYDAKDFKTDENTDAEAEAAADEKNEEIAEYCANKWWEFYEFVTKSSDADFKKYFENFFVLDSALYYYLFTTRYTMVDNRAKNSFWHYSKTGGKYEKDIEYTDENGKVIFSAKAGDDIRKWDLNWGYDMDTALGTDNDGDMVYRYGYEDTDVDADGVEIFRESDSTFFCRVRDLFASELATKYKDLESAWNAEDLINQFDTWQSQFPEELWRTDIERKYIRTYSQSFIGKGGDAKYLDNMANGKKKYQRRQYERNQEKYMASKYRAAAASSDANKFVLRTADTSNDTLAVPVSYDLTIRPYTYMYLVADYGVQGLTRIRVTDLDKDYVLKYPGIGRPDFVNIESAHWVESLGDLSPMYLTSISTAAAVKLKELLLGSDKFVDYGDGNILTYYNKYLTTLTTDSANGLLEKINIENVNYENSLDVSNLPNLREVYANGSSITGFIGANGGTLVTLELPDIGVLTLKNLSMLETLTFEGNNKLTTINVENCNTIDLLAIVNNAPNLRNFRVTGVNWTLENGELLERIYAMSDYTGLGNAELSGYVKLASVKEQDLAKYKARWKDLVIEPSVVQKQYLVTYENPDGTEWTELAEWVVDRGTATKPEFIPTQAPTAQYEYQFKYWALKGTDQEYSFDALVRGSITLVAIYTPVTRTYTIRYLAENGTELYKVEGATYGSYVNYVGDIPTSGAANLGEYALFAGWDQSGYVTKDKDIKPLWQRYLYGENTSAGTPINSTPLNKLLPVELYAQLREEGAETLVSRYEDYQADDVINLQMGEKYDNYTDLSPVDYIAAERAFAGTSSSYVDTKTSLFEKDEDFVFVIDYKMDASSNGTLCSNFAQNFGFKLYAENGVQKLAWGEANPISLTSNFYRETLVIQHKQGEPNIKYYFSNKAAEQISEGQLNSNEFVNIVVPLTFGAEKSGNSYTNAGKGIVYWARKYNGLLGDAECRALAAWTHETISMFPCFEVANNVTRPKTYPISGSTTNEYSHLAFMSSELLELPMRYAVNWNQKYWKVSNVRSYLNKRIPSGISILWQQLLVVGEIKTYSDKDSTATEDLAADTIFLPAASYLQKSVRYDEGYQISCFSVNPSYKANIQDTTTAASYWTRTTTDVTYPDFYYVTADGELTSTYGIDASRYLRIMLNF